MRGLQSRFRLAQSFLLQAALNARRSIRSCGCYECEEIRMLAIGLPVGGIAVDPEELGHTGIASAGEPEQPPAECGG